MPCRLLAFSVGCFMQRVSWDCAVFIGEDAGAFGCADCFPRSHALELAFCRKGIDHACEYSSLLRSENYRLHPSADIARPILYLLLFSSGELFV